MERRRQRRGNHMGLELGHQITKDGDSYKKRREKDGKPEVAPRTSKLSRSAESAQDRTAAVPHRRASSPRHAVWRGTIAHCRRAPLPRDATYAQREADLERDADDEVGATVAEQHTARRAPSGPEYSGYEARPRIEIPWKRQERTRRATAATNPPPSTACAEPQTTTSVEPCPMRRRNQGLSWHRP